MEQWVAEKNEEDLFPSGTEFREFRTAQSDLEPE